jgi:hypothetical protein
MALVGNLKGFQWIEEILIPSALLEKVSHPG